MPRTSSAAATLLMVVSAVLVGAWRPARAADYFVRPTGDDAGAGTSHETAWRTLAAVNQRAAGAGFAPGDRILLLAGSTFEGGI